MLKRLMAKGWRWYANSSGVFLIVLIVTYGIVAGLNGHGRVLTVKRAHLLTPTVKYLGAIKYTISLDRHKSCPGTRVISFTRATPRELIVLSTPATQLAVGPVIDANVSIDMPPSVYPGPWRIVITLESSCPNHKQRDPIVDFNILVTSNVD